MPDVEMTIIVKDDKLKAGAEEGLRELIDVGRAEVFTFEEFGEFLLKLFKPTLDQLDENIETVGKHVARLTGKEVEPEAEEEIPDPEDIGEVIAEAALSTWHRKGPPRDLSTRKPKPDPPGLHTSEDLEHIPEPDPDSKSIIDAAKRTWSKGRSLFGGD